MILITGGAGFIGSNFILDWLKRDEEPVINLDSLSYAGNPANLQSVAQDTRYHFVQGNIADMALVSHLLKHHQPRAIIHFAAETHVDRAIHAPQDFMQSNVLGTFNLLECTLAYWTKLSLAAQTDFRFLHISSDEVYGSLGMTDKPFTEYSPYQPNNPYAASKAASDHWVRAYQHTYQLPTIITHACNNYGPYQFPEKLIPAMLVNALSDKPLPIYGTGEQVRDWLYVSDHCAALRAVLHHGKVGEVYNIGGSCEKTNIDVVNSLCAYLDERILPLNHTSYKALIHFVTDRVGHDYRYALNTHKITTDLAWKPQETFASGLAKTIDWYLAHKDWLRDLD